MTVRMAAVAGRFYEGSTKACLAHIKNLLPKGPIKADLPERILAGVVPHAGWVFSGDLAALVFAAIKQQQAVDTFVIFGAIHTVRVNRGLLYESGQWGTPLGTIDVDDELAEAIADQDHHRIIFDRIGHQQEHSIEVQVPFIQHLFPEAKIVPLLVPPVDDAPDIGQAVGRAIKQSPKSIVCIASTDLTHYGPGYGCTPMGSGPEGIRWAKEKNDQFFIDLALNFQADQLVDNSRTYNSACGGGAVAAVVASAQELGSNKSLLLGHTTSAEVMVKKFGQKAEDSVGYAAIVFG